MSTRDFLSKPSSLGGDPPRLTGCPEGDALVSYLYDEFEPASVPDRRQLSRHLRECPACAAELEALGGVRAQLPAWVAPDLEAGFRLVQEPVGKAGWRRAFDFLQAGWFRPVLPYAAAMLVLGAGLALARLDVRYGAGGLEVRTGWGHSAASPAAGPVTVPAASTADLRAEIESLRQELRRTQSLAAAAPVSATSLTGAPVPTTTPASGTSASTEAAMMRRLRQLVDDSEMRQQQNLQLRISEIARDFRLARQADMVQVEQGFSRLAGQRQQDVAEQQKRLIDAIRNVSLQSRPPE